MHIQQPCRSKLCGQCCIAMLANVPLERVITILGNKGTRHKELIGAAHRLGLTPTTNLWSLDIDAIPPKGLILMKQKKPRSRNWHWIAMIDGTYHDPAAPTTGVIKHHSQIISWIQFRKDTLMKQTIHIHEDGATDAIKTVVRSVTKNALVSYEGKQYRVRTYATNDNLFIRLDQPYLSGEST